MFAVLQDDYLAEIFQLVGKKKKLLPVKSNTQPIKKLSKKDRSREFLAKRTQLKIFQNVPFSSDLGQAYLCRVRNFILTEHHVDKIERHVNSDNHSSNLRRSDVGVSNILFHVFLLFQTFFSVLDTKT